MFMLLGVAAAIAVGVGAVGVASGASTVKCGGLYQSACSPPTIATTISAKCHKVGSTIRLPAIVIKSTAGLKTITISLKGRKKPIKVYKNLNSALRKTVGGITISTKGLKPGAHRITIKVTDTRGKTVTKTVRIAICVPKPPPFTG
jgi:hypothetical protein